MWRKILLILLLLILIAGGVLWYLAQPDPARISNAELTGRVPVLSQPRSQTIPTVSVATAVGWRQGQMPTPAPGLEVKPFAQGLDHPRNMYILPNGDVLVAETNAPPREEQTGIRAWIEGKIMGRAGARTPSANRIALLRDSDGDGIAETKTVFLSGLNSPYGMALIGNTFYVANTDALMAYDYTPGATAITSAGRKIIDLPAFGSNSHWTKPMVVSADGKMLYIGIGSNSNIAEGGLEWERGRAQIIEVRPDTKYKRPIASGLRNPSGLAINPMNNALWTVVNERDMLGSDLVPDYMTEVEFGGFYGWPWYYWGGFTDTRVPADPEDRAQYVARPNYALGAHVAPLGFTFVNGDALGSPWTRGAVIALHGSWNREPRAGYKVVFVPFDETGRPLDALPIDVLSGFINNARGEAMGRPADVRQAKDGALLVADDVGNTIWRVARPAATAAPRTAPTR